MTRLRVAPAYGQGRCRLYVSLPDGRHVAWYDRSAAGDFGPPGGGGGGDDGADHGPPAGDALPDGGRVCLVYERHREAVLAALAPYLTGDFTIGPPPVPTAAELAGLTLHPDDDLAPNRPGEALHGSLGRAAPAGRLRRDPLRVQRAQLAAEELLGAGLDLLVDAGWRILHSVPLPGADRVDHLAIGPGGVLAVHTLAARRLRVRVQGSAVRVGRADPVPLLRLTRRRAERASLALATAVRPVLAVVGAARLETYAAPSDVRLLRETGTPALARLGGVHKPADIEALYTVARDRRTWLRA
ncbi:nuclease-related domain-containing protein [Streptomyces jumonjinensis]|uniref:NERD domain-containing protein n=1 Tax=Streptomyces jumonjinensis TaxID=1945 RepID=A0A646KLR7_STRJU|nr:nuclease-related domain-containing protein [Streptomyces jumonjinensis]MQT03264.1 NERD domain-containing protein [Streptomyces jumonjinensis]